MIRPAILSILFSVFLIAAASAQPFRVTHPMDALTYPEVNRAVELVRAAGLADAATAFAMITLKEMPKAKVLAWRPGQPFTRSAFLIMRRDGRTIEATVDLTGGRLLGHRVVPGAQPSIMTSEWKRSARLVRADGRWRKAMRRRGYDDFDTISCPPQSAGHFPQDGFGDRRIFKVSCYHNPPDAPSRFLDMSRPIEGVIAIVDADGGTVIDVIDTGPVIRREDIGTVKLKPPPARDLPKPVLNRSPEGPNFSLKGSIQVDWNAWSFHVRGDRRAGLVISLARFRDGGEARLVAYQLALSEMFVPYMDPHPGWRYKTFLDVGEYGLGYLASSLEKGRDCPQQSVYVTMAFPSDRGGMFRKERAVCIFERATGDPAWRHANVAARRALSAPKVELVVRMIPTIGNYDYILDYVFESTGQVRVRVGATGMDAVKTVPFARADEPGAEKAAGYGMLVAPYKLAPYHDHYFSFRIDLDVDGQVNTLIREHFEPNRLPGDNPRRSLWTLRREAVKTEGPVVADPGGRGEIWRIVNPARKTELGHNTGYQLEASTSMPSILSPDDPPQMRAAFSAHKLWVTAFRPEEYWAAGDYPNQGKGGEGLPRFVADRQNVENEDLVLWYTIGFRHVTRPEDWPVLPARWFEFRLRPYGFFTRDPSHDVAPHYTPQAFRQGSKRAMTRE